MKRKRILIITAIAITLTLVLASVAVAQEQGYRIRAGDTLASIARQYCTTWQDIYYNNEGILGSDPNALTSGTLIYVVDRCNQSEGVYDRGPSPYANGYVVGNIYTAAQGDTWYSIGVRFGLPWRDIARANGGEGVLHAGRQLRIPGLNQGVAQPRPPAVQPAIKIISPQSGTALPSQFLVSGTAQGLHEGSVVVRALDSAGNLLAQAATSAQGHDVAIGGAGIWSVQLGVYVPAGTPGKIAAVGSGVSVQDSIAVTFGGTPPPAVQPSISIVNPQAFAALPPRFTVNGTGQGIGWNDIVVQAVDNQNRVLAEARTKLQGHDVGAGGQGTWSAPLEVYAAPGTPGRIRVVVDGTEANLSRDVTFGGQSGYPDPGQSNSNITRFTVDRQQINPGECVTFYWNTSNARTVYFYREGEQSTIKPVEPNPSHYSACPPRTSVHYLQVIGQDGLAEIRAIRIWVGERQGGGPGPVIPTFTAIPDTLSVNRRCATLNWTTGGSGIVAATLYRNGQPLTNQNAASPYQDCVPDSLLGRELIYELKVDSELSGWTSRQVRVISVGG